MDLNNLYKLIDFNSLSRSEIIIVGYWIASSSVDQYAGLNLCEEGDNDPTKIKEKIAKNKSKAYAFMQEIYNQFKLPLPLSLEDFQSLYTSVGNRNSTGEAGVRYYGGKRLLHYKDINQITYSNTCHELFHLLSQHFCKIYIYELVPNCNINITINQIGVKLIVVTMLEFKECEDLDENLIQNIVNKDWDLIKNNYPKFSETISSLKTKYPILYKQFLESIFYFQHNRVSNKLQFYIDIFSLNSNLNEIFTVLFEILGVSFERENELSFTASRNDKNSASYTNFTWRNIIVNRFFKLSFSDRQKVVGLILKVSNTSVMSHEFQEEMAKLEKILGFKYKYASWMCVEPNALEEPKIHNESFDFVIPSIFDALKDNVLKNIEKYTLIVLLLFSYTHQGYMIYQTIQLQQKIFLKQNRVD
jgi:hypothetical protein